MNKNMKATKDGSQFDHRTSELKSMGELYINIHDAYLRTLQLKDWDELENWLNRMRVFNSYLKMYVPEDKREDVEENREEILDILSDLEEKKDLQTGDLMNEGVPEKVIRHTEEVKEDLEKLRDDANFTLPQNRKSDPDSAGVDQL